MRVLILLLLLVAATATADWVNLSNQVRRPALPSYIGATWNPPMDAYYAAGWRLLVDEGPVLTDGYYRVSWEYVQHPVTSTWAVVVATDAPIEPQEFRFGVTAPAVWIRDVANNESGIALACVSNALVVVDGWGSPQHTLTRVRADAQIEDSARVGREATLRDVRSALTNAQASLNDAWTRTRAAYTACMAATNVTTLRTATANGLLAQRDALATTRDTLQTLRILSHVVAQMNGGTNAVP